VRMCIIACSSSKYRRVSSLCSRGVEREFSSFTLTIAQLVVSIVRKCCTCQ
jgi:hypothetical protein